MRHRPPALPRRARSTGFTLVEALISLLVLAFGMLAVVGLQTTLAHNADVARQRTEATRLAQARIEALRAYQQVGAASGAAGYADIVGGSDTPETMTNTVYERRWTVSDDPTLAHKLLQVTVRWADRRQDPADTAERQSVALTSMIARVDPKDAGSFGVLPVPEHRPHHGMPPLPTVGRPLGDGRSAIQWPDGRSYIVWNPAMQIVERQCSGSVTATTDAASLCSDTPDAWLVTGTLSGLRSGAFRGAADGFESDAQASAVGLELVAGDRSPTIQCQLSRVPADGLHPRPPDAPPPTRFVPGHYAYACLIPVPASGARGWSGSLRVTRSAASLMQPNDAICRLSWDQDGSGEIDSAHEHPDPYSNVVGALHGQNFVWVERLDAAAPPPCPAAATVNGVPVSYALVNLIR